MLKHYYGTIKLDGISNPISFAVNVSYKGNEIEKAEIEILGYCLPIDESEESNIKKAFYGKLAESEGFDHELTRAGFNLKNFYDAEFIFQKKKDGISEEETKKKNSPPMTEEEFYSMMDKMKEGHGPTTATIVVPVSEEKARKALKDLEDIENKEGIDLNEVVYAGEKPKKKDK